MYITFTWDPIHTYVHCTQNVYVNNAYYVNLCADLYCNKGSPYVLALPQGPLCACSMLWAGKPDDKFFTMKAVAYMLLEQPPTMCVMATKSHNTGILLNSGVPTHNQTLFTTIHHWHEVNRLSPLLCTASNKAGWPWEHTLYHHRQQG